MYFYMIKHVDNFAYGWGDIGCSKTTNQSKTDILAKVDTTIVKKHTKKQASAILIMAQFLMAYFYCRMLVPLTKLFGHNLALIRFYFRQIFITMFSFKLKSPGGPSDVNILTCGVESARVLFKLKQVCSKPLY